MCSPCHELCATCSGAGVERCESCMFVIAANGSCAYQCDNGTELNELLNVCISVTTVVAAESNDNVNIGALAGGVSAGLMFILVITILLVLLCTCIQNFRISKITDNQHGNAIQLPNSKQGDTAHSTIPEEHFTDGSNDDS